MNYHLYKIIHPIKNWYWRKTKGYGCCDIWSLYYYLAKIILPQLKGFRQNIHGYPSDLKSLYEWEKIVDKMIWSFEYLINYEGLDEEFNAEKLMINSKKEQEGFELFGKYFRSLWL